MRKKFADAFVGMDAAYRVATIARIDGWVDKSSPTGCHIWKGAKGSGGYGLITLAGRCFDDNMWRRALVHRVAVYLATGGWYPPEIVIMHRCDTPLCCNVDHLEVSSHQGNVDDARAKLRGTWMRSRLKPDDVRRIRKLLGEGRSQKSIDTEYGMAKGTACRISKGRTWGWVKDAA
jgi:hypothetical protein